MAQTFHAITPVEVTPEVSGSHQEVDCSELGVPIGATGVILHIYCALDLQVGLRKGGSVYDHPVDIDNLSHCWAMAGLDENRVFECEVEDKDNVDVWLIGYTTAGVTFLDAPVDISLGVYGSLQDIDCSVSCPDATGIIIDVVSTQDYQFGFTMNGSTDDRPYDAEDHLWAVIGCDESQIIEAEAEADGIDFYIVGYITDGCTFKTNADDKSIAFGDVGSYVDVDCSIEAPDAGFLLFEVVGSPTYSFSLRTKGESGGYHDIYASCEHHPWAIVLSDGSQVVEGKIANSVVDFFLVGYTEVAAPGEEQNITEAGAIASVETFGGAQLNLKVEPSAITSLEAFGTPLLFPMIKPEGIVSAEAFGSLVLAGPITCAGIASLEAFGTAQLNLTIYPFTIIMSEEFGTPVVLGALSVPGIASLEAFGAVVIAGPITCEGIVSGEEFGSVVVAGPLTLTGIASLEAFGSLVVMGVAVPPVPMRLGSILELHDSDGTLIAVLHEAYNINYIQLLNAPHSLSFALKGDDNKLSYLTLAREIWLRDYKTGVVTNKFKMTGRVDTRV